MLNHIDLIKRWTVHIGRKCLIFFLNELNIKLVGKILFQERNKTELAQSFQRKEKELAAVAAKIEDEQSLGIKMQKQVKELAVKLHL